jgi:hypothetical protein
MIFIINFSCNEDNFPLNHKGKNEKEVNKQDTIIESNWDSLSIELDTFYFGESPYSGYLFIEILFENSSSVDISNVSKIMFLKIYENDSNKTQLKQHVEKIQIHNLKQNEMLKYPISIYGPVFRQYPNLSIGKPEFEDE